jgi:tetratricopeptide (TPR) repeat protein
MRSLKADRQRLWDAFIITSGALLAGLTLKTYRIFDLPSEQSHLNRETPGEAESIANSAKSYLVSQPEDFNAWLQLGIAYYYKGPDFYPDGLNALEKARALGATNEVLFYYAGVMYDALGLPDYAANELSKYLRHHPDDYETQVRLANLFAQQKKTDEAYKLYQVLVKKWPKDPTLWFNFAMVSKEKGDLEGASSCFAKVKEIAKVLPEGGLFQEGEIARLKGSDDQAISFYQQELAVHPEFLPALTALEAAQRRKSMWKEARLTRQKIADLKSQTSKTSK